MLIENSTTIKSKVEAKLLWVNWLYMCICICYRNGDC